MNEILRVRLIYTCHDIKRLFVIILSIIFTHCSVILCNASELEKQSFMRHFIWKKREDGQLVTSVYADDDFLFFNFASMEFETSTKSSELIKKIIDISGLRLKPPGNKLKLAVFSDRNIMEELRDEPERFKKVGLSNYEIKSLIDGTSLEDVCYVSSMRGINADIHMSYILDANNDEQCLRKALYFAFGVTGIDSDPSPDMSLCVLYQSRRLGSRTREEISNTFDMAKQICDKKIRGVS